ncbi:AI-2E family transporter [Haloferula chungangensis]|uniref:AI-2E family transporter n=1 Tax=Haloferula chungangensis TaxID=1048331 RepID=A0ABW2L2A3_9BACT
MVRYPSRFQIRTLWNAATGVSIFILGALIVGFFWLFGQVFGFLQPVLVPLAVAAIIAYLLDPIVRWFQKRGMSRGKAVVMTFGSATGLTLLLIAIMIPLVGNQIDQFKQRQIETNGAESSQAGDATAPETKTFDEKIIDRLIEERNTHKWTRPAIDWALSAPESLIMAEAKLEQVADNSDLERVVLLRGDELSERLDELADNESETRQPEIHLRETELWYSLKGFQDEAVGWARGGTSKILGFLGLVIGFFMVPIYLYYFLRESAAIKEHWHDFVPLKASRFKTELIETLTEVNQYLISFFRGQVLVAFIDGFLVGIALTIFGLPLGLLIGIMMALLGIIPYIGNIITLIPACILAYFHFSAEPSFLGDNPWSYVIAVIAIFIIVQQINSLVTAPKIVGDSVGLHPMTVIFSMLFWSLILGGFVGALLAVPLSASVKVLFRRYIWERQLKEGPSKPDDEWSPAEAGA